MVQYIVYLIKPYNHNDVCNHILQVNPESNVKYLLRVV